MGYVHDCSVLDLEAGNSRMNKTTYFQCMMDNNMAACSMDSCGILLTSPRIHILSFDSCNLKIVLFIKPTSFFTALKYIILIVFHKNHALIVM